MHAVLVVILVVILALCLVVLLAMGVRQRRRRSQLAGLAERCGLRFSWRDPFGLVQRYGACRLMQAGHSGYVDGVLHGRYRGWNVRVFDFHFEVGHGTRRLVRRYCVVASELPQSARPMFAWRRTADDKAMAAPLPSAHRLEGRWYGSGDLPLCRAICRAWGEQAHSVVVEFVGRLALFATGDRLTGADREAQLNAVVTCLGEVAGMDHCISDESMLQEGPIVEVSTPTRRSD